MDRPIVFGQNALYETLYDSWLKFPLESSCCKDDLSQKFSGAIWINIMRNNRTSRLYLECKGYYTPQDHQRNALKVLPGVCLFCLLLRNLIDFCVTKKPEGAGWARGKQKAESDWKCAAFWNVLIWFDFIIWRNTAPHTQGRKIHLQSLCFRSRL